MGWPRVSVIIPSYNCDRYLGQAIDSVLHQTFTDYEVIVIDDGSTDNTAAVLEHYGDRIRAVRQKNQGVALARNHGIGLAQGEWIAFLDADDFFFPDKLAAQIAVVEAEPTLGIVHSGWQRVDAEGNVLMTVEPWQQIPKLTLESWLRWKPVLPSAMLFRREWLVQSGGFDARFPPAEDTELVLRLARLGCESAWLPQVTVGYRQHPGSAMHKGLPQAKSLAAVIEDFFAQPDLPESIRLQENSVRYHTLVWIAWYLHYTGHPNEMVMFLQQAWHKSPYPLMEAIVHWADSFTAFSQSWGHLFDAEVLARSAEWQDLVRWLWQQSSIRGQKS
ncbi:MAG TPA: glycosyltransferase [Trichocoleus sp.]|jgi:glycosyltransferase involved in cell wall biosynthesis